MSEAPEAQSSTEVEPLLFEGQVVEGQYVQIPAIKLEVDQVFARGSYLTLRVEYRVRNVRYDEDRKGVLARHAVLVMDGDAAITAVESAESRLASMQATFEAEIQAQVEEDLEGPGDIPAETDARRNDDTDHDWEYPTGEGATAEITSQSVEEVFAP